MTYGSAIFARYWSEHSLPAEYRRVEYLESTGEQWIDTGVAVSNHLGIEATIKFNSLSATQVNGGYSTTGGGTTYRADFAGVSNGKFFMGCSGNPVTISIPADTSKHHFGINTQYGTWRIDDASGSVSPTAYPTSNQHILAFARQNANKGVSLYCMECLYSLAIEQGGDVARSYVPCVRIADSKAGLYDLCGSTCPLTGTPFYVNAGTGADFAWGELQF